LKKFISTLFFIKLFLKILLLVFDYLGDESAETLEKIFRYFTKEDLELGISYARAGFPMYLSYAVFKDLLLFWLLWTGSFLVLQDYCLQITNSKLYRNLFFFLIIYFFDYFLTLPLSYYSEFYIEHKFGFSNMSLKFWIWTELKSIFISCPIFILSSSLIVWAINSFKKYWFFIVPTGGLVFGIFTTLLYPIIILPIFYKIQPLEEGKLKEEIFLLTKKTEIEFSEVYIIEESEYSKHTNAFFIGFGNNKKIYLYDNLLKTHTPQEIISILAHEIGHWKYDHNLKGIILSFIGSLSLFWLLKFVYDKLKNTYFPMTLRSSPSNVLLLFFLFKIFFFFISPLESIVSREMEKQADLYELQTLNDPETFISVEVKMAKENRSRLNPHPISSFFWNSHPTTLERIEMAENYKKFK